MKDFLLVLFYQAIVAVNTAVILSSIIWLAKRKDEKDGRKPNPDFTPPPTRYSGGYQPKPCEMPKPPTTGSAAIKPKCGISADEAAKLISKLAEASACLGGNSELDELQERVKGLADRLDRAEKKPVTPERLKEAGFEVEPVNVFNPAEESVKRYEARTEQLPHYCGNCIAHRQEKFDGEIIHVCMRHKVWLHNQERWDGGCDAWEPSPAICKLYKEWADGFCASCEYFEPDEPGQKRGMGLCARNDEIKMMGQSCAGYTRKGELPKYLERQPMETPEPLGTVTTH
jgi:hypothetical protein